MWSEKTWMCPGLTVPVLCGRGALPQPVQTPVQSVLDPVLGARRVLHLHRSASADAPETEQVCFKHQHYDTYQSVPPPHAALHGPITSVCTPAIRLSMDGVCYRCVFCMRSSSMEMSGNISKEGGKKHTGLLVAALHCCFVIVCLCSWNVRRKCETWLDV